MFFPFGQSLKGVKSTCKLYRSLDFLKSRRLLNRIQMPAHYILWNDLLNSNDLLFNKFITTIRLVVISQKYIETTTFENSEESCSFNLNKYKMWQLLLLRMKVSSSRWLLRLKKYLMIFKKPMKRKVVVWWFCDLPLSNMDPQSMNFSKTDNLSDSICWTAVQEDLLFFGIYVKWRGFFSTNSNSWLIIINKNQAKYLFP